LFADFVFGYIQPGWKNASIFWLASGDARISWTCADCRPAALVRWNISRSYFDFLLDGIEARISS
jgi:hypothetical protein